jgi:hypothetical protein
MFRRLLKFVFIYLPLIVLGVAIVVVAAWAFFFFVIYLGFGNYQTRGHQEFARNGVSQIEPARQMEELFENCRHFITYTGPEGISTWDAEAYFGGRYHLSLQVPVEIESATRGRVIGEPRFYLWEVESVSISPSGQVHTSFVGSGQLEFGRAEWLRIVAADGVFGAIGYHIKTGPPIPNFEAYARRYQHLD